ncbi:MAG: hypothetical protein WD342_00030 [Verrucomicrobiales bacterium]
MEPRTEPPADEKQRFYAAMEPRWKEVVTEQIWDREKRSGTFETKWEY